jgi:hypothetical protein
MEGLHFSNFIYFKKGIKMAGMAIHIKAESFKTFIEF